jgi:hypothetical protein
VASDLIKPIERRVRVQPSIAQAPAAQIEHERNADMAEEVGVQRRAGVGSAREGVWDEIGNNTGDVHPMPLEYKMM